LLKRAKHVELWQQREGEMCTALAHAPVTGCQTSSSVPNALLMLASLREIRNALIFKILNILFAEEHDLLDCNTV
jgi:hypothetical protein